MPEPDSTSPSNKFRAALEVLNRGRDVLLDNLADDILDNAEDYSEGGFLYQELLDSQGVRLQLYCVIAGQLEMAADTLDEKLHGESSAGQGHAPRMRRGGYGFRSSSNTEDPLGDPDMDADAEMDAEIDADAGFVPAPSSARHRHQHQQLDHEDPHDTDGNDHHLQPPPARRRRHRHRNVEQPTAPDSNSEE